MASGRYGAVLGSMHRLFGGGSLAGMGEGELLRRFATRRDPAAFEGLVARHGPMVLGVCRRILSDSHEVDDAFQAVFLILVKKAGSLRDPDLLGPWLHGVAHRVAVRSRANAARRRLKERPGAEEVAMVAANGELSSDRQEMRAVLDEEIARLPERFRRPVILCYLEGLTHDEAAIRLKCPVGTVRSRMSAARSKLRDRLSRRGITLPATLFGATLAAEAASAAVPQVLIDATVSAAIAYATTGTSAALAGTVSAGAASLAEGVTNTMFVHTLKLSGAVVLSAMLTVGGAGAVAWQGGEEKAQAPVANPAKQLEAAREEVRKGENKVLVLLQKADALQAEVNALKAMLAKERAQSESLQQTIVAMKGKAAKPIQYALIGKMDMDGNVSDDRDFVKKKIQATGGVVAYELPPQDVGKESGKLTPRISLYVQDESAPAGEDKDLQAKAIQEARNLGIRPITLKALMSTIDQLEQQADIDAAQVIFNAQAAKPADDKAAVDPFKKIEELERRIRELTAEKELMRQREQEARKEAQARETQAMHAVEQFRKGVEAQAAPGVEKAKADPAGDKESVARAKRIEELQRKIDELNAVLNPINEELQLKQQLEQLERQVENAKAQFAPKPEKKDGAQRSMIGNFGGGGMGGPGGMGGGNFGGRGGVGKGQGQRQSVVTLENEDCIIVQMPNSEKVSAYSVEKGEWSSFAIPKGVQLIPSIDSGVVLFAAHGDDIRQLVAYDAHLGKWLPFDLKEPTKQAVPIVGGDVAHFVIGRRVYAFSLTKHQWDVLELDDGAKPSPFPGPNLISVQSGDRLYVFSAETGKWTKYDETNPAVVTPSGKVVTPPKD